MGSESMTISQVSQRPPSVHFNSSFFNRISTSNYKHIELSPEADKETVQLARLASNDNYFAGNTTGLFYKPEEHLVMGQDGDQPILNPTLGIIGQTCPGYARCADAGETPVGKFMLIA